MCAKYFLQIHSFGEISTELSIYYVDIEITTIVAYATLRYSKTCITHKRNLRVDGKFGNKIILSTSTELCHKNIMLGLQNGPLNDKIFLVPNQQAVLTWVLLDTRKGF